MSDRRVLSISELEQLSGFRREVIYFYIRRGLLPKAQKASATRAIYGSQHVELLERIRMFKERGLTLEQMKSHLATQLTAAGREKVDLAADQQKRRRDTILEEAARQFAERGYKGTRIGDIVQALGITPQQLYSFFPTKHHLFVACYNVFYQWMRAYVEPRAGEEADPGVGFAWRLYAGVGVQTLVPDLQALAQAESLDPNSEVRSLIRETYECMLEPVADDLRRLRAGPGTPLLFSDELTSYALLGALHAVLMRVSWDEKYTPQDMMRAMTAIYLAIEAAYEGRVDISARWAELKPLVDYLSRLKPPKPPTAESVASMTSVAKKKSDEP